MIPLISIIHPQCYGHGQGHSTFLLATCAMTVDAVTGSNGYGHGHGGFILVTHPDGHGHGHGHIILILATHSEGI